MKLPRHVRLGGALGCVLLFSTLAARAWPFTVDDAYIVARYASRLASGRGYTFDDGPASDGVTGPLWLLPLWLAARLGGEPVLVAKALSLVASGAALWLVLRRAAAGVLGGPLSVVTGLLASLSLPFVSWSSAGLETGLACLCTTALALAAQRPAGGVREQLMAGTWAGAIAWLRPELVPCALVLLGALVRKGELARSARVCTPFLLAMGVLLGFRLLMFGHVLPLSAHAKPAVLANGARYLLDALATPRGLLVACLLALSSVRPVRRTRWLTLSVFVHALAVLLAGGDWMPARRLFAPLVPLLAWLSARTLLRLSLRRPWLACAWLLALLASSGLELARGLAESRAAAELQQTRGLELARRVCALPGPVAMIDVGLVGARCPQQRFLDLAGLTEPWLAHAAGGHLGKRVDPRSFEARAPAAIVLHSRDRPRVDEHKRVRWFAGYAVERNVLALPFVQREFEVDSLLEYTPRYHYVLLKRRVSRER